MKKDTVVLEEHDDYFRVEFFHRERGLLGFIFLAKDLYDELEATEVGELLVSMHHAWWQQREYLHYLGGYGKATLQ